MKKRFGKRKLLTAVIAMLMALMMTFAGCTTQGPAGPKGDKGDQGIQGPAGPKGDKGDKGDSGKTEDTWTPSGDIVEKNIKATATVSGVPSANGKYYADYASIDEAHEAGQQLSISIAEEGFVLLKNENNALPLTRNERNVTTFGFRSTNIQRGGGGSGSGTVGAANDAYYKIAPATLEGSLTDAGFKLNQKILNLYKSFGTSLTLEIDPDRYISDSMIATYGAYSDAAIVVLGRSGMEGGDLLLRDVVGHSNPEDHELQLTDNEVKTIKHVKKYFNKVIVLINSSSAMQIDDLNAPKTADNLGVDAIIHVGHVGNDGIAAVGKILTGEVNPSGRTVDTWASEFDKIPAIANFGDNTHNGVDNDFYLQDGTRLTYSSLEYREDIYMGYRYYETVHDDLNKENAGSGDEWYEKNVEFPFGYGLSYTEFEWQLDNVKANDVISAANQTVTMRVRVKNVGNYAGKDVVEIYAHTPYKQFGIEKASQVLVGFAKTKLLQQGESDIVTIQFVAQDMASFDYNDANGNGFVGYELEAGDYVISARRNSNTPVLDVTRSIAKEIKCETDYTTGEKINAVLSQNSGQWAEYNTVNGSLAGNLLSRTEITGEKSLPKASTKEDRTISQAQFQWFEERAYGVNEGLSYKDKATDPWYVKNDGIPTSWTQADSHKSNFSDVTIKLKDMAGIPYTELKIQNGKVVVGNTEGDKKWEAFLNQLTWEEMRNLLDAGKTSYFNEKQNPVYFNSLTKSIEVGRFTQNDGPQQLKGYKGPRGTYWVGNVTIASTWNTELIEEQGRMYGNESILIGIPGVYAPSMNMHRSPFGGRNFEYCSEDGLLAGKIAAAHVRGVVSKGAIVFIKHLFLNDQEYDRATNGGISTFVTEQAAREIYLKPFELCIKEGHANGIMASFNRVGNVPAATNTALFNEIIRGQFGFRGYVMTDAWTDSSYSHMDACVCGGVDAPLRWGPKNNVELGQWKNGMVYVSSDGVTSKADVASPTQWAVVRRAAQHVLYAFANSNDMQNGVSESTTINIDLAPGMSGINSSVFMSAIGTSDISDLTFYTDETYTKAITDPMSAEMPSIFKASLNSRNQMVYNNLCLSENGVLSGNTNGLAAGTSVPVYVTYRYDGLGFVKKAVINVNIVNIVDIRQSAGSKLAKGSSFSAELSSIRYAVGQSFKGYIMINFHGLQDRPMECAGVIDKVEYTLAVGSNMPAGLTLGKDGKITGTPTASGAYDIVVRVTSFGMAYGSGSNKGQGYTSQSNFYKFTLNVAEAGGEGSVTFGGEMTDTFTVNLNRNINGADRKIPFVVNKQYLKDEIAKGNDFTIGVAYNCNNNYQRFVVYLTFMKDGKFTVSNALISQIGAAAETIEGTWSIDAAGNVTMTVTSGEAVSGATITLKA